MIGKEKEIIPEFIKQSKRGSQLKLSEVAIHRNNTCDLKFLATDVYGSKFLSSSCTCV